MKWQVGTTKYQKEKLEELCVGLRNHCKKSLQKFLHDLAISALLEFRRAASHVRSPSSCSIMYLYSIFLKTNILCERAERIDAQILHQNLIQIVEEILSDMPQLCVTLAGGSNCPVTHREVNITQGLSNERFHSRWVEALDSVRTTLASWLKQLN